MPFQSFYGSKIKLYLDIFDTQKIENVQLSNKFASDFITFQSKDSDPIKQGGFDWIRIYNPSNGTVAVFQCAIIKVHTFAVRYRTFPSSYFEFFEFRRHENVIEID